MRLQERATELQQALLSGALSRELAALALAALRHAHGSQPLVREIVLVQSHKRLSWQLAESLTDEADRARIAPLAYARAEFVACRLAIERLPTRAGGTIKLNVNPRSSVTVAEKLLAFRSLGLLDEAS